MQDSRVCARSGPPFIQLISKYIYVTEKSLLSFFCCVFDFLAIISSRSSNSLLDDEY
jgi:hypothetical protein